MTLGLDYAAGRPSPAAIRAAGYEFVVRYLSAGGPALPGKQLLPDEYAALRAAGIEVVCNWESTATRMQAGQAAGFADALGAAIQMARCGVPADQPVYFSADWDASPADQVNIDAYLRGAASALGPGRALPGADVEQVGIYGGFWVVKRCLDNGTARWGWQASAWSPSNPDGSRQIDPRAHLYQHVATTVIDGVECDVNEALAPVYGQAPVTGTTATEDDMAWRLERTKAPLLAKAGDHPDAGWDAVEDTVALPGPAAGWHGRILAHVVFGWGGGLVQEAWWGGLPSSVHVVLPATPVYVGAFSVDSWEAPAGARFLVLRYAAPAGGSVGIEVQH